MTLPTETAVAVAVQVLAHAYAALEAEDDLDGAGVSVKPGSALHRALSWPGLLLSAVRLVAPGRDMAAESARLGRLFIALRGGDVSAALGMLRACAEGELTADQVDLICGYSDDDRAVASRVLSLVAKPS